MFIIEYNTANNNCINKLNRRNGNKTDNEVQNENCFVGIFKGVSGLSKSSSSQMSSSHSNYSDSSQNVRAKRRRLNRQCRKDLPTVASMSYRYDASDRATAAIASAALYDYGVISKESLDNVVDKNKVRREKTKINSSSNEIKSRQIENLYFDGRKDNTLTILEINGSKFKKIIKEDHISLLTEPENQYVGHITCKNSDAKSIVDKMLKFFNSKQVTCDKLSAMGCDNTNTNTGIHKGIIRQFEILLNRPLQWIICLLHANKLPLRHLIEYIDGSSTGPYNFSGSIGKLLNDCEKSAVVKYKKIPVDQCDINFEYDKLSCDQKYLLDICNAVITGHCPDNLANRSPGNLNLSRWLTTANRILRFYISDKKPSKNLKLLTE